MKNLTYDETVRRIAALPAPEPRIVVSGNSATPMTALHAVTESRESCRVLQINGRFDFSGHPGVLCETPFVGPGMRHSPRLDYLPMRLSLVPRLFDTVRPPDAVLVHTSVPRDGKVSLGIEVNILPAAIERVRARGGLVMAQLNPQMPYTYGASEVPIDSIDVALEVDEPLLSPTTESADDVAQVIGERVARFAEDGSTLQLGIGLIPALAAGHMASCRGIRVWSEMISDGVMELENAGASIRTCPSAPPSSRGLPSCTGGRTGTSASRCCGRRRSTTPHASPPTPACCRSTAPFRSISSPRRTRASSGGRSTRGSGANPTS